jgi:RNA polymerase sigma-70 factor (sigma-E family)
MSLDSTVEGGAVVSRDAQLTALFVAYHRSLVGFALLLVEDLPTAEDVVQDAFLALHRRWTWIRDPEAAYSYVRTAVVNGSRSQLRRRRVRSRQRDDGVLLVPSAEATAVENSEHEEVLAHLAGLPTRQRQVLVLRYYLDQSEAEIAATLAISRGSVKQHASRGLAALTAALEATS